MKKRSLPLPDIRILTALFIILLCLQAAFWAHEHVYKATPDYSLQVIVRAIREGDVDTTKTLIDDQAIAAQLFDSMAAKGSGIDSLPVLQLAWAPFRDDFIKSSSRFFELAISQSANREEAEEPVRMRLHALGFPLPVSGWHYASNRYAQKQDDTHAEMTITLYNEHLDAYIPCTVKLTRLSTYRWRITELRDATAFVSALTKARTDRLTAYNLPLQRQLDELIRLENVSASLVHSKGSQTFLRITYTPVFTGKPGELREIRGIYELERQGDHAILYSGTLRLTPAASGKPHTSQFLLNPLIPSQNALINRGSLDDTQSTLQITSITRADGTTISLAEKLPDWP